MALQFPFDVIYGIIIPTLRKIVEMSIGNSIAFVVMHQRLQLQNSIKMSEPTTPQ